MELELTDEIEDPLSLKSIQNLTMIFSYHSSLTECVWKCQGDAQCIGEFYHPRRFYACQKLCQAARHGKYYS